MHEKWHSSFNPERFLRNFDVERLLSRNEARRDAFAEELKLPCFSCGGDSTPGIRLNNGTYLCASCFKEIALINYPEAYEQKWRQFISEDTAWTAARQALVDGCLWRKLSVFTYFLVVAAVATAVLIDVKLLPLGLPFLILGAVSGYTHDNKVKRWDSTFTRPERPVLKHFHDPSAELTGRDRRVLEVFDHWPGYPPYWDYLRDIVRRRDNQRCQVTGCPSRLTLHVHHKVPVSSGGCHAPDNLVTLCDFHHALEPEPGHERIWGNVKTKYFTMVRKHERRNPARAGTHTVRPHLRRLELVKRQELEQLSSYFGFSCSLCGCRELDFRFTEQNQVVVTCIGCGQRWQGPRQLAEENGPKLAELLTSTKNTGSWTTRWEMLDQRTSGPLGSWRTFKRSGQRLSIRSKMKPKERSPKCPVCGARMKVVRPRPSDSWKPFWGCTKYRVSGCRGSLKYRG